MTVWDQIEREVEDFMREIRTLPACVTPRPDTVRREIDRFDFVTPISLPDLIDQVADLLRRHTIHVTHPRYFGLFNPSVTLAGVVADTLAALYNPQLATWSHSPAANEIERTTLRYFARALGFDADRVFANFTTGGLEANLSAVIVALTYRFPVHDSGGMAALPVRPLIYVTSESHHSFVKICRIAGLGRDALREVPTTDRFTMDPDALRTCIGADAAAGACPLMVVASAGTTGGGVVDPIAALAAVASELGVWLHVDAAWGGAAALVPRLRETLSGVERADSVTWDAHKWLSVPMGAGMFFCRHREAVGRAFAASTSYMPSAAGDVDDPYLTTVQWSRRAIGLKVFMSLAESGHTRFAARLDHHAQMADLLRVKLRDAGWIVVNDTVLPLVCFTHDDVRSGRCTVTDIVRIIQERGRVWISDVVLGGRERVMRACVTSFRTEPRDLDVLIDELEFARRRWADVR